MRNVKVYFASSVGQKQVVAVTGLIWSLFVLVHMAGNLLLIAGPDAYNRYSHTLVHNPATPLIEIILVVSLLMHLSVAARLTLNNRAARPKSPLKSASGLKAASFASRSMIYTGLLVLIFVILHLITFKYGATYTTTVGGVEMRDLYKLVFEKFHDPLFLGWYVVALIILGIHLSHGVGSFFQTVGLASVRSCKIKKTAWIYAAIITFGFMGPAIFLFTHGGS